jgi:hypothetical protein
MLECSIACVSVVVLFSVFMYYLHKDTEVSVENHECTACTDCANCTKCTDCKRCRYCIQCENCNICDACQWCVDCGLCYNCVGCTRCRGLNGRVGWVDNKAPSGAENEEPRKTTYRWV